MPTPPPIVFSDYIGVVQLKLKTADDLDHIHELEPARWSSTSVPTSQLLCDEALLAYIDTDQNRRIRLRELLAAHDWLRARLKNRKRIAERTDTVYLDDLDTSQPDAARLRALGRKRIKVSGQALGPGASISLAEIRAFREGYKKKFPNGDGVVAPAQIADGDVAHLAGMVTLATGGAQDLSGDVGVNDATLDTFLALGRDTLAWEASGELPNGAETSVVLPLGADTAKAFELVDALTGKLDQFFAQCDLFGQGEAAEARLAVKPETLAPLDVGDPEAIRGYLRSAAIARPSAACVLDFDAPLNPLYAGAARELAAFVLPRALGEPGPVKRLDRAGWEKTRALFESFRAWQSKKPKALPDGLAGAPLRALLEGPLPGNLRALVIEDQKASAELVGLGDLEKFALLQRWILDLANNMVSFPALFSVGERCLFEVGTLILDGREINLCLGVEDIAEHRPIADTSNVFVAYVDLERREGDVTRKMHVAAGVTWGSRRGISVGKRGVFYDREDKEWDARVTDVIVKPISVLEAALAPFIKLREFIGEKMTKLLGSRSGGMEKDMTESADARVQAAAVPAAPPAPLPPAAAPAAALQPPNNTQGLLVGGGIAFAAVGSAAAFALQTLANINPWNAVSAVTAVVLAIMAISGFLGWLKLRRRDVSTLLEASGWAFNVRIYLRRNLSLRFTRVPPLPKNSVLELHVLPVFESSERRTPVWRIIVLVVVLIAAAGLGWYYNAAILARIRHFME